MNSPSEELDQEIDVYPTQDLPELVRDIRRNVLPSVIMGKIKAVCRWLQKTVVEMLFWSASDQES